MALSMPSSLLKGVLFGLIMMLSIIRIADAQTPPPPSVDVLVVKTEQTRLWTRFSGRLSAVEEANIKPLVGGQIKKVFFEDGDYVEQDQPLFLIDPRPYQAMVDKIQAQIKSAESRYILAKDELERARALVKKKLVSESVFDQAKNQYLVSKAAVEEAKSALAQAQLDVDYSLVKAPFDGQISRAELTVGNIVETNTGAPVLATLVSNQRLYGEFSIDEQSYLAAIRANPDITAMPVEMRLTDGSVYQGQIYAFDNQLDAATGTIRARAIFDNTDGILKPGMYADIRLGSADKVDVLMIPQQAIGTNQTQKFVYVIDDNNVVQYRTVTLGQQVDKSQIILSGLNAGDKVVVNGVIKIRPDMTVSPNILDTETAQP